MPRINDRLLDCVFYLYRSTEAAQNGEAFGGTGFFVGVPTGLEKNHFWPVAVSNKHVVCTQGASVLRINTREGGVDIIEAEPHEWIQHPDGDDLVVFPINYKNTYKLEVVSENYLLNEDLKNKHNVGPGDDVFMIGRFINHDGKQKNQPSVRFGNISMNPLAIRQSNKFDQVSYGVEMRSMSGFSGSPVFMTRLDKEDRSNMWSKFIDLFFLVGINWGHIVDKWDVIEDIRYTNNSDVASGARSVFVQANTGMNGVIPAWKLKELLHIPKMEQFYAEARSQYERAHGAKRDVSQEPSE